MFKSPLLQPFAFGADVTPTQSAATSQASQRDYLKPSQAKEGDYFYRYESHLVSSGVDEFDDPIGPGYMALYCSEYVVTKVTQKGAVILDWCRPIQTANRPVMDHYINKYAYPSKVEALLGFIARKKRQQSILFSQYSRSREAEQKAERLLAKELEC